MLFAVWAPTPATVGLWLAGEEHPLTRDDRGWWRGEVEASYGDDYAFVVDGERLKDPRSPWQPDGSLGLSRLHDPAFAWTDDAWAGGDLGVIYELHIGTFTPEGTLDAAVERLGHLVDLGVDTVEVMPVNGFDGDRGWGYDGVDLWAVHRAYGGPDALKRFVDAAHAAGLSVLLDVVYNHLGPSGNLLPRFGPYLTDAYHTPWGPAVNLDHPGSDEVRRFFVDNALRWLEEFHLDGLRLDAVHAFADISALTFLEQLATEVDALGARTRPRRLIAESDLNDPGLVRPRDAHGIGLAGMWADDLHHCVHTALTGELEGYYCDYGTLDDLATAWAEGYLYAGRFSEFRQRTVGRPVPAAFDPRQLVVALQNHDQVGNRAAGDRLPPELLRIGAAITILSPMTPLLFMGEEWGASTPFAFFASPTPPELADATRTGRREEFVSFGWRPEDVPDPIAAETFEASKLDWSEAGKDGHAELLEWYRHLITLRREHPTTVVAALADDEAQWLSLQRGDLTIAVNLADTAQPVPAGGPVVPARDVQVRVG